MWWQNSASFMFGQNLVKIPLIPFTSRGFRYKNLSYLHTAGPKTRACNLLNTNDWVLPDKCFNQLQYCYYHNTSNPERS